MSSVAIRMGMMDTGLKLQKLGQLFQVWMLCLQIKHQKKSLVYFLIELPDNICHEYFVWAVR